MIMESDKNADILWMILLWSLAVAGCSDSPVDQQSEIQNVEIKGMEGQQFELVEGATAHLTSVNLDILFKEVVKDGRCPTDVNCIWAGDAALAIRIEDNLDTLHTTTVFGPDSLKVGPFMLKIRILQPRLNSEQTMSDVTYRASFILR